MLWESIYRSVLRIKRRTDSSPCGYLTNLLRITRIERPSSIGAKATRDDPNEGRRLQTEVSQTPAVVGNRRPQSAGELTKFTFSLEILS